MAAEELFGLIYSEFDNEVGPRLVFQYPEDIISTKSFETLSDYIIVGKHLCEKIMIIQYENKQIVNYSVAIENSKYGRNTLSFALGFILNENVDSEPYETVLRKISNTLIALELESEYLFCSASKASLEDAMKVIFHGLTTLGEAYVRFDKANLLTLKLYRQLVNPPPLIHDYDVPMLLLEKGILENIPWDITAHKILPHINGKSCARKIALDAEVDLLCAKRCLRILLFYQCILISDIFAFSNVYITTPRVLELSNPRQYPELESFCTTSATTLPPRENIYRFLLSLRPGVQIGEIIASNPKFLRRVDLPRLLGIAQHFGMIRRVRKYPILRKDNLTQVRISQHFIDSHAKPSGYPMRKSTPRPQLSTSNPSVISNAMSSCGPSTDEICCVMELARGDLEESVSNFVWK